MFIAENTTDRLWIGLADAERHRCWRSLPTIRRSRRPHHHAEVCAADAIAVAVADDLAAGDVDLLALVIDAVRGVPVRGHLAEQPSGSGQPDRRPDTDVPFPQLQPPVAMKVVQMSIVAGVVVRIDAKPV